MRLTLTKVLFLFFWLPMPVFAQDEANETLCKKDSAAFEERLAACDALINSGNYTGETWVLMERGDTFYDSDQYEPAVDQYNAILADDPDFQPALRRRAYALNELERYEEALADTTRLVEMEPDSHWLLNLHGLNLQHSGAQEEALAVFARAMEVNPEYIYPVRNRGWLFRRMDRHAEALDMFLIAHRMKPLNDSALRGAMLSAYGMGDMAQSLKYARMLRLMAPNIRGAKGVIDEQLSLVEDLTLPPAPYQPPQEGLTVRYLQSFVEMDTRDEMEVAIMAIADWFSPAQAAEPEALSYVTRKYSAEDDVTVRIEATLGESENLQVVLPLRRIPPYTRNFRGLFPTEIPDIDEGGPVFAMWYETGDPETLWPLEVGKHVEGTGSVQLVCPESWSLIASLAGCTPGVEFVSRGELEYGLTVEKAEQIHVPLGIYDTYLVRYRSLGSMEAMGRRIEQTIEVKYWIAPELGIWIKRTNERNGKIAIVEAVEFVTD